MGLEDLSTKGNLPNAISAWVADRKIRQNRGMHQIRRASNITELKGEAREAEQAKELEAKAEAANRLNQPKKKKARTSADREGNKEQQRKEKSTIRHQELLKVYPRKHAHWDKSKLQGPTKWCSIPCEEGDDSCETGTVPCEELTKFIETKSKLTRLRG